MSFLISPAEADVLHQQLNAIAQQIGTVSGEMKTQRASSSAEAGKCLTQLANFVEGLAADHGVHAQALLGQHVCSNVLVLALERLVKPALTGYAEAAVGRRRRESSRGGARGRDAGTDDPLARRLRQDVVRPFRALLRALHRALPPTERTAPTRPEETVAVRMSAYWGDGWPGPAPARGGAAEALPSLTLPAPAIPFLSLTSSVSVAPLLWKAAAPLLLLCQHVLEVLCSEVLAPVVGVEYTAILQEVLQWQGYVRQLSGAFVLQLCGRLLTLVERCNGDDGAAAEGATGGGVVRPRPARSVSSGPWAPTPGFVSVEAATAYAMALAHLFLLPQLATCDGGDSGNDSDREEGGGSGRGSEARVSSVSHLVRRLTAVVKRLHTRDGGPTAALRLEANCLRALRHLVACIQHDHPRAAAQRPFELVRVLCNFFALPATQRKEGWRLEALAFLTTQLCLSFTVVMGSCVHVDLMQQMDHHGVSGSEPTSVPDALPLDLLEGATAPPWALAVLHETVLPMALRLFTQPRQDYGFASRRELLSWPCPPLLRDVFEFGAVAWYLACITWDEGAASRGPEGEEEERRGERPGVKRPRGGARDHPEQLLLSALQEAFFVGAAAAAAPPVILHDTLSDAALFLLHLVAQPTTTLHFRTATCDRVVEGILLPVVFSGPVGERLSAVLLAALRAVVPRCSPTMQWRAFSWLTCRYIPLPGHPSSPSPSPLSQQHTRTPFGAALFSCASSEAAGAQGGVSEHAGPPRESLYEALAQLVECVVMSGCDFAPLRDEAHRLAQAVPWMAIVLRVQTFTQAREEELALENGGGESSDVDHASPPHISGDDNDGDIADETARHHHPPASAATATTALARPPGGGGGERPSTVAYHYAALPQTLSPALSVAMVRLLAQYTGWRIFCCSSGYDALGPDAIGLLERGLRFVCVGFLHACVFYRDFASGPACTTLSTVSDLPQPHPPRGGAMGGSPADVFAGSSPAQYASSTWYATSCAACTHHDAAEAQTFATALYWVDRFMRVCVIHSSPCAYHHQQQQQHHHHAAQTSADLAAQMQAARTEYLADLERRRHSPSLYVPLAAAQAAEAHWLMLHPRCAASGESADGGGETDHRCSGAAAPARPPGFFTATLASCVREAMLLMARRVRVLRHELHGHRRTGSATTAPHTTACDAEEEGVTQSHMTLAVQCVQLLHTLVRWHAKGLWHAPGEREGDGTRRRCRSRDDTDDGDGGGEDTRDEEFFSGCSADALFADPAAALERLSHDGQVYYSVLWLSQCVAERLSRCTLVLYQPVLRALSCLFADAGAAMLSPALVDAEPHRTLLHATDRIARRVLADGVEALAMWRPSNTTSTDMLTRIYGCLQTSLNLLQGILYASWTTRAAVLDPGHVCDVLVRLLQREGLVHAHGAVAAEDEGPPQPFLPLLLLPCLGPVVALLQLLRFFYAVPAAGAALAPLLRGLCTRHRFVLLPDAIAMLGSAAVYAWHSERRAQPALSHAALLQREGLILEDTLAQLMSGGAAPPLASDPLLWCAVLRCAFDILPRCEAALAERLGRIAFKSFAAAPQGGGALPCAPYVVRRYAALQVHVLFKRFSSDAGLVLRELLVRCREGMLSVNRLWCATSLLALAEASAAAPWLEAQLVYTLLECWATRGFVFRGLLLQCLERMSGCLPSSPASLAARQLRRPSASTPLPPAAYAQLCRYYTRPLLFWWLCRDCHPLEALPATCFGFSSVEALGREHLPHLLPPALLLLGDGVPGSVGSPLLAWCAGLFNEGLAPQDPALELAAAAGRSSSAAAPALLFHFSTVVSRLLFIASAAPEGGDPPAGRGTTPAVARSALQWLEQMLEQLPPEPLLRLLLASSTDVSAELRGRLTAPAPARGTPRGVFACLLKAHADCVMCHVVDLAADDGPGGDQAVAQRTAEALAARVCGPTAGVPALPAFLGEHGGSHVYVLVQHLYDAVVSPLTTPAEPREQLVWRATLLQFTSVCTRWLPQRVLRLPHVFRTVVAACANALGATASAGDALRHELHEAVCRVLLHVWTPAAAGAERESAAEPIEAVLATRMLGLAASSPVAAATWPALCRADPALGRWDWRLLNQQDAEGENPLGGEVSTAASPPREKRVALMLPLLQLLQGGGEAMAVAAFTKELSQAVDAERHALARCIRVAAAAQGPRGDAFCTHLSRTCLGAVHRLSVALASGGYAAAGGVGGEARLHSLDLLSCLCRCFVEAGEAAQLDSAFACSDDSAGWAELLHETAAVATDDAAEGEGGPWPTPAEDAERLFARAYGHLLCKLYQLAFHEVAEVAALAVGALRGWLAARREISSSSSGGGRRTAAEEKAPPSPDDELMRLVRTASGAPDSLPPLSALAPLRHGTQQGAVPRAAAPPPATHLLDPALWEELALHGNEPAFLALFVLAVIDTYDLSGRWRVLAAVRPLLAYEAAAARQGQGQGQGQKQTALSPWATDAALLAGCPPPLGTISAALLRVVLLHAFLLREGDAARRTRRQWCARLDALLFSGSGARRYPRTVKLFLRALLSCKCVAMARVRVEGLEGFQTPGRGKRDAAPYECIFGVIPALAEVGDCYWLSDIPATHVARAAARVREPYIASGFMQLSGESLLGPRSGIPASLISACGSGVPSRAEGAGVTERYSLLFPWATRENVWKASAAHRDAGEPSLAEARALRRQAEAQQRNQRLWRRLARFTETLRGISVQVEPLLPAALLPFSCSLQPSSALEDMLRSARRIGAVAGARDAPASAKACQAEEVCGSSSSGDEDEEEAVWRLYMAFEAFGGQLQLQHAGSCDATDAAVLRSAGGAPLVSPPTGLDLIHRLEELEAILDGPRDDNDAAPLHPLAAGPRAALPVAYRSAILAAKARTLLQAGLPHAAVAVIRGRSAAATVGLTAELRAVAAEAAWRCAQWWQPMPLQAQQRTPLAPPAAEHDELLETVLRLLQTAPDSLGGAPASFHESLLRALGAIQRDDSAALERGLRGANAALLRDYCPTTWPRTVVAAEALRHVRQCADWMKGQTPLASGAASGALAEPPRWLGALPTAALVQLDNHDLLGDVHHCLCQLLQDEDCYRAFLLQTDGAVASLSAAPGPRPHRVYERLKQYEGFCRGSRARSAAGGPPLRVISDEEQIDLTLLYARALYNIGRHDEAVAALQQGPPSHAGNAIAGLFTLPCSAPAVPRVVRQLFAWSEELRVAPLSQIVRDPFFSRSASADHSGTCSFDLARACHTLANEIAARLHTHEYQQLRASVVASQQLRASLEQQRRDAQETLDEKQKELLHRRICGMERDIRLEEAALQRETSDYALYRRSALNSYARYLQLATPRSPAGDEQQIYAVFSFTELWLHEDEDLKEKKPLAGAAVAAAPASGNRVTDEVLGKALRNTPAHVFLPCFNQLVAQLGASRDEARLTALVQRVAREHPLEAIWPLLALCNGQQFGGGRETDALHLVDERKVAAARGVVEALKRTLPDEAEPDSEGAHAQRGKIIADAEVLSAAYMELALYRPAGGQGGGSSRASRIASGFKLVHERACHLCIPPPTSLAPPGAAAPGDGCAAAALPRVVRYRAQFTTPGGINAPKVLQCELSDGTCARQLLKANDDLRQDALIEQVFAASNVLLAKSPWTRAVAVYTYRVVPLAPTVGVLQWIDNTIPLGNYLTGDRRGDAGAHERYFPGEPTTQECAERFARVASSGRDEKRAALLSLYATFTPALHYFFIESFAEAREWLEKRHAFMCSAAAASMVGYVVGLGDRHASNILLHRRSAAMIHIDLGIAFDQSKLLPVPELVPFRLTRNIVDGLGVLGTGGGFSGYCAATLAVLRQHRSLLLSILSAFVHDPLARWSVALATPLECAEEEQEQRPQLQRHNVSAADAQRALSRVAAKLSGHDRMEQLSVSMQVQQLLQDAQSVENLSAMFRGWSPWL